MNQLPTVIFNPSNHQLKEIRSWLISEEEETGDGFFCNWDNSIMSSYEQNAMAVISVSSRAVGFITWLDWCPVALIQIAEIAPSERRKGLLKELLKTLVCHLRNKGIIALRLQCSPASSEIIWKKLGFVNCPYQSVGHKQLNKILIPHLKSNKEKPGPYFYLDLWDKEPTYIKPYDLPRWRWKLGTFEHSWNLTHPIVHPAKPDWRITFRYGENIIYDGKLKRFSKEKIDFYSFLILKTIPLKYRHHFE